MMYLNKIGVLYRSRSCLLLICMMFKLGLFAQMDTLDAIYINIVTNNKELIGFSSRLNSFPKGDPENLMKGINSFNKLPDQLKDTALLIFIYYQRAFSYFEGKEELEMSFYNKYNSPHIEKVELYNEKLNKFGIRLFIASEGFIATTTVPGFIESNLKDSVPENLKKYLSYYTLVETLQILFYDDNYFDFFIELIKSLSFMESYLAHEKFCNKYIEEHYYYSLINSIFYDREQELMFGLEDFNMKALMFKEQLTHFTKQKPLSKTSKLINLFLEAANKLSDEDLESLFYSLENKECPDIQNCNCKEEDFNYSNMERNIEKIIKCIEANQ